MRQYRRQDYAMFPTSDDQCPARGPGLSHTSQPDSVLCKDCGTPLMTRGLEPGPLQKAIAAHAITSRKARCQFLLCNNVAEVLLEVQDLRGTITGVPVCYLCREDFRLGQREGRSFEVSIEGTLYVIS